MIVFNTLLYVCLIFATILNIIGLYRSVYALPTTQPILNIMLVGMLITNIMFFVINLLALKLLITMTIYHTFIYAFFMNAIMLNLIVICRDLCRLFKTLPVVTFAFRGMLTINIILFVISVSFLTITIRYDMDQATANTIKQPTEQL